MRLVSSSWALDWIIDSLGDVFNVLCVGEVIIQGLECGRQFKVMYFMHTELLYKILLMKAI
jgi:hypothetical protein